MKFFKKGLFAAVLAASLLPSAVGCSTTETPASPQEIAVASVLESAKVQTVRMQMDMVIDIDVAGGQQPMSMSMDANVNGVVDSTKKQLNMAMSMDADIPGLGKQQMSTDMYVVDNWLYMKTGIPGIGPQWTKMKLTEEMWQQSNQFLMQAEILKSAIEVTSLSDETVDGIQCYVLSIKPDMEALAQLLSSQMSGQPGTDMLSGIDFGKFFKSTDIKVWISKKDQLPVKEDIVMAIEMQPEDVGANSSEFTRMTMNMTIKGKFSDYNKPVTITLPVEAQSAKETATP